MLQDSWCFYEERLPKKRIFHPRKRSFAGSFLTIAAALTVIIVAITHL
ncbi:MAG TPA: hypothetical protein VHX18_01945 [Rhizomicrobium sp.]|nr:hypothetical protein [Rhizomicrobium sp.]